MSARTVASRSIPPARERRRRTPVERLLAALPWASRRAMAAIGRLPVSSRLRRRLLTEAISRGFAAINRRDDWFIPIAYEPDCEIFPAGEWLALGLAERYRGHQGWAELNEAIYEYLPDLRWEPEHVIDLGDRVVLRVTISGGGRTSGAQTRQTVGFVYHVSAGGRIARQDAYWVWADALDAAGISEPEDEI